MAVVEAVLLIALSGAVVRFCLKAVGRKLKIGWFIFYPSNFALSSSKFFILFSLDFSSIIKSSISFLSSLISVRATSMSLPEKAHTSN